MMWLPCYTYLVPGIAKNLHQSSPATNKCWGCDSCSRYLVRCDTWVAYKQPSGFLKISSCILSFFELLNARNLTHHFIFQCLSKSPQHGFCLSTLNLLWELTTDVLTFGCDGHFLVIICLDFSLTFDSPIGQISECTLLSLSPDQPRNPALSLLQLQPLDLTLFCSQLFLH